MLFHPFSQCSSECCQVAFGPEPIGHYFTTEQVHMHGTVSPGRPAVSILAIFTHTVTVPSNKEILFGVHDDKYK